MAVHDLHGIGSRVFIQCIEAGLTIKGIGLVRVGTGWTNLTIDTVQCELVGSCGTDPRGRTRRRRRGCCLDDAGTRAATDNEQKGDGVDRKGRQ